MQSLNFLFHAFMILYKLYARKHYLYIYYRYIKFFKSITSFLYQHKIYHSRQRDNTFTIFHILKTRKKENSSKKLKIMFSFECVGFVLDEICSI